MKIENITVNLEEYLKFYIKKWKINGIIIIAFIIAFSASTKLFGNVISVPHSEEYLHYEKELEWHKDYLDKSILMNLNPTEIYTRTLFLENVSNQQLMHDYITSLSIWEGLITERDKTYITELVTWKEESNGVICVDLRTATAEECEQWANYLKEKIQEYDSSVTVFVGEERVVTDEKLQEEHLRWYSRIYHVESLLLESQAGFTIEINMMAAMVTGGLIGAFISVFFNLVYYMMKRK